MMARSTVTAWPTYAAAWLAAAVLCSSAEAHVVRGHDLGAVSGTPDEKWPHAVTITRALSDPVVLSLNKDSAQAMPTRLVIGHAVMVNVGSTSIKVTTPVSRGSAGPELASTVARTEWELALFVDGERVRPNLVSPPAGEGVALDVPGGASRIELAAVAPIVIRVPAGYQGSIETSVTVTGDTPES